MTGATERSSCCRLCASPSGSSIFSAPIFGRPVTYFKCQACGYVQTEMPNWLDKAYASAINACDTGIMLRNQSNVPLVLATLKLLGCLEDRVVDCAGGYGILVRLLRDSGVDAAWSDPYCQNLLAVGFEHGGEPAGLVTAFEAFEHFVDPSAEMEKLLQMAPNLLISTSLIPDPTPEPQQWWYYGLDHGQHIGFFRLQSLQHLADRFGRYLVTNGADCHLFSEKPISEKAWKSEIHKARNDSNRYSRVLKSKTWADFEKMSQTK